MRKQYVKYHNDGTMWAKGIMLDGIPEGYWEWFRKDGSKLRSGYFAKGKQTGDWTTYDRRGKVYKVTSLGPKKKKKK
jgi:antitoxin component YwqK of YwqJK toxin-antitoxin module